MDVTVSLGPGARLRVRSVAAQLVHPCPSGRWATVRATITLGAGAQLRWAPEPIVVAGGARFRSRVEVHLHPGARFHWRDELVLGRHDEDPDTVDVDTALRVDADDGTPLVRDGLRAAPGWRGAAVLGTSRYVGTEVVLGPGARDAAGPGWLPLAVDGAVRRVLADDAADGRRAFEPAPGDAAGASAPVAQPTPDSSGTTTSTSVPRRSGPPASP